MTIVNNIVTLITSCVCCGVRPGVGNVRPLGRMRPARQFDPAHQSIQNSPSSRKEKKKLHSNSFSCDRKMTDIITDYIMATGKKRKIDAECRAFQEKCTNDNFLVEVKGKPVCLICGDALAVMKKANLERHYSSKHGKLN